MWLNFIVGEMALRLGFFFDQIWTFYILPFIWFIFDHLDQQVITVIFIRKTLCKPRMLRVLSVFLLGK